MKDCRLPEETYVRTELTNTNFVFRGGKFIKVEEDAPIKYFRKVYYTDMDKCLLHQGAKQRYWGFCQDYKNPEEG